MKIILTSFKELITVKELMDAINNQLKALNLNQAGVNIYFKQYPNTENNEELDLPEEVVTSGLNTVVFDTKMNTITVYISGQADVINEIKDNVNKNAEKINEIDEKLELTESSITNAESNISSVSENVTLLTSSISTINETLESLDEEIKTLKQKVETLEGHH